MIEYGQKQQKLINRVITKSVSGDRQLKGFMDNRDKSHLIKNIDTNIQNRINNIPNSDILQTCSSSNVIQCAHIYGYSNLTGNDVHVRVINSIMAGGTATVTSYRYNGNMVYHDTNRSATSSTTYRTVFYAYDATGNANILGISEGHSGNGSSTYRLTLHCYGRTNINLDIGGATRNWALNN